MSLVNSDTMSFEVYKRRLKTFFVQPTAEGSRFTHSHRSGVCRCSAVLATLTHFLFLLIILFIHFHFYSFIHLLIWCSFLYHRYWWKIRGPELQSPCQKPFRENATAHKKILLIYICYCCFYSLSRVLHTSVIIFITNIAML